MSRASLAFVFAAAVCLPATARADDPGERAAHRHYERGEKLYNLKKYADALHEYQQAFDASPAPELLYNIAQCYRNLGNNVDAVFTYKRYLKAQPDAANRDKVEHLIAELQARIDKGERGDQGDQQPPPDGDDDKFHLQVPPRDPDPARPGVHVAISAHATPFYKAWWFWTGVAIVGVGAGVGAYVATRPNAPPDADFSVVWPK